MLEKQVDLLATLTELTYGGKVVWAETEMPRQFALHLRSGTVLFDEYGPADLDPFGPRPPLYRFAILDAEGRRVDQWTIRRGDRWFEAVADFFGVVRTLFGRSGRTIDAMIAELEGARGPRRIEAEERRRRAA